MLNAPVFRYGNYAPLSLEELLARPTVEGYPTTVTPELLAEIATLIVALEALVL